MKEASCKLTFLVIKDLESRNLSPEILCKNTAYNIDYLRNQKNYVEWDVFCQIMLNARVIYKNDEDYTALGIRIVKSRMMSLFSAMLGFFVNPRDLLRLLVTGKKGLTGQAVTCISSTFTEVDEDTVEITGEMHEGYRNSREFFLVTKGVIETSPILIKYKPAHVVMTENPNGAHYKVTLSKGNSFIAGIKQLFSAPSSKKAAARELTETYELLYERYSQLEESQQKIQKQAKQLETAYSISQLIRSDLDLDFTLNAVAESLINVAGFAAVEINIHSTDQEPIERTIRSGNKITNAVLLNRKLEARGKSFGEIFISIHSSASIDDAQHLLEYIIPLITMEIFNAMSYKLVNDYREKLEQKVNAIQKAIADERKRIAREIHDDLGTNLSTIALISGVMRENVTGANVEKISVAAQQSLEKISEIVWSLNPKNDKLENLFAFIRRYAVEYFEPTTIKCKVNMPGEISDAIMKGEKRRNIFLSVKEALHNVLKHSEASFVELSFSKKNTCGEITIHDNGKGIAADKINSFGNGLQNMKQRMESAGGYFIIENSQGTIIRLGYEVT